MNVHVDGIAHIVPRLTAVTAQKQTANLRREAKFFGIVGIDGDAANMRLDHRNGISPTSFVRQTADARKFSPTVSAVFALPQRWWFGADVNGLGIRWIECQRADFIGQDFLAEAAPVFTRIIAAKQNAAAYARIDNLTPIGTNCEHVHFHSG